ncbi:hypothetical protein [Pseudanabaena sp. 'Roaring Creek']|uniref:hypothetical protein n=1 Tax=Pseudanabaena sp. 'Roaring Creek' TaxID=1681830 RepID=UPI0006D81217|nr:hypothetical protein [Pseudanabaena sp. 'Roaring Creek']
MNNLKGNLFKSIYSWCDFLRTKFVLLNITSNGIPFDTLIFIIGFSLLFANLFQFSSLSIMRPNFWQAFALHGSGLLFFPYTFYYIINRFYKPIPFFYVEKWTQTPTKIVEKAIVFGKFDYLYEKRGIQNWINNKTRTVSTKVLFHWNHGQIEIDEDNVKLDVIAEGALFIDGYQQGIMKKPIKLSIDKTEVDFGRAFLLVRNLPAIRFTADGNVLYAVFIREMNN